MGMYDKVQAESPSSQPQPSRVGGQFIVYTFGEGKAAEFFDYDLACTIEQTEDVYIGNGDRGIEILIDEDIWITSKSSVTGTCIARFDLFGPTHREITKQAKSIISRLQLQPQFSPILP